MPQVCRVLAADRNRHHLHAVVGGPAAQLLVVAVPDRVTSYLDVVEPLGSEILLYLDYGTETPMIVRAEPRSPFKPGDKVEVLFKPERLHMFDAETELTIL